MRTLRICNGTAGPMSASWSTLAEVCQGYLDSRWGVSKSYRADLTRSVRYFEAWHGGIILIKSLSESLLGGFLRDFSATHTASSTNNRRRHLLTICTFAALEHNLVDPPRKVPKLTEPRRVPDAWTLTECEQIFRTAAKQEGTISDIPAGQWWISFLLTLYWCGERVGAVRQVRCVDYDTSRMALWIRPEFHKTKRERLFLMPPVIHSAIAQIHNPSRELLWPWDRSIRRLFPSFARILEEAGIVRNRKPMSLFHKLRRTSGTLCELNGGSGHKHLGNTEAIFQKHYFAPSLKSSWESEKMPLPHIEF